MRELNLPAPQNRQHYTPQELEQLARTELHYFSGNPTNTNNNPNKMADLVNPFIVSGYGLKQRGLGTESTIRFQFDITNINAAARTAILNCGYQNGHSYVKGLLKDGAFNDKSDAAGLTGVAASNKKIEDFQGFINRYPTRLKAIQIRTANSAQFATPIIVRGINPFTTEGETPITFGDVQSQADSNDKVLNANLDDILETPLFIGADKLLEYTLAGNSSVSFTFYLGYIWHQEKAFEMLYEEYKKGTLAQYIGQ